MPKLVSLSNLLLAILALVRDAWRFIWLSLRSRRVLAAENLFLRKQLALYLERKVKPHRASDATRLILVLLSGLFAWREALTVVKRDTFIRWHRKGFRLFWRWKSKRRGRPRIPAELQKVIVEMANENPIWGEERIATIPLSGCFRLGRLGAGALHQNLLRPGLGVSQLRLSLRKPGALE